MDSFTPQSSVHENVKELRGYLGSHDHMGTRTALMPRDDLAALVAARHPKGRAPNGSTVQRWEDDTEPDIHSIRIMADLAGVSVEVFAFGQTEAEAATADGELVAVPAPHPRRALSASKPTKRRQGRR